MVLKLMVEFRMKNRISLVTDIRWRAATLTSHVQDKPSELSRMVELSQK